MASVLERIERYNDEPDIARYRDFGAWPMDNTAELAELMVGTSEEITDLHRERKALISDHLSSLVLEATGPLIFREASAPRAPVLWISHDVVAKQLLKLH